MANLLYHSLQPGLEEELFVGADASAFAAAAAVGLNAADESLPYSTSELNAPEYSTDDFRMFQFKVARCSKRFVHDWRACPFAHPTENARRRDPRMVKYLPIPCPDYKRGICLRGDACNYSHGVYECWLHPAKYRTQLCKEGPNCRRPVCFFAHSVLDLRQPNHHFQATAAAGGEEVQASMAAVLAAQQQQQAVAAAAAGRMSSDGSAASAYASRLSSEEALNNLQDNGGRASSDAHSMHSATASVAAILAAAPAASPSRAATLSRASSKALSGGGGSAPHSPYRSGSPNTPSQVMADLPAARSAEGPAVMSDAAAALAVLTQQQAAQAQAAQAAQAVQAQQAAQAQAAQAQAQAAAQAAAALARLSMDSAAARGTSVDLSAAAVNTQAMLAGAGVPPRMSLDSLLASRQAGAGWTPGAPPTATTAAAALAAGSSGLPLNEQPFPSGNAPRMSNAVARKLGLAPQRASLDARLSKLRGGATPPRTSLDGILQALQQTSARSSLEQQALLQQAAMTSQQMAMAGLNGMGVNGYPGGMHGAGMNGNGMNGYASPAAYGMPPPAPPAAAPDMDLHPALLNLVAAQMQQQGPAQQMPAGMMPPPGVPNGMHSGLGSQHGGDANMAALMDSLNGWQLNGGPPPPGASGMGHRGGSMDGMTGMAGAPVSVSGAPAPAPGQQYYDAKGIWAAASSQEAINNSAAGDA